MGIRACVVSSPPLNRGVDRKPASALILD